MSWLPKDLYPPGSGIDSKRIEDLVMGDIIKQEIRRSEQVAAILTKVMLAAQQEDDASSSYEYYDDDENEEEYEEGDYEEDEPEFEEDYDDEEEEDDDDDESQEESEYDTNEWASLFLLVNGMPTENEEPKSLTRKRSLTRDETPCPPPEGQPAKRQKTNPSVATRAVRTQEAETNELDMPSSVPSEWLSPQPDLRNSQLPAPLRTLLQGTAISELHLEAQAFLLSLDYSAPGAKDMGKAAIDMGIRFSKTARRNEYNIVLKHMASSPLQAVMYNACHDEEAQHILFWEKVQDVTGRDIPPERIKERRERCEKRRAEFLAISRARQAEEEAKRKTYQNLKERFVKQIGEATKLPLNEKVTKWLSEIIPIRKR
ncbi:hypothetical protein FGRMN_4874 [Fusarium graminum]|nr:hypothetical protein FGRMN_4874 [Fusarium graminum]